MNKVTFLFCAVLILAAANTSLSAETLRARQNEVAAWRGQAASAADNP